MAIDTGLPARKRAIRSKPMVLLSILLIVISLTVAMYTINAYVSTTGAKHIVTAEEAPYADAILVLGAYVFPDGSVSWMLSDRLSVGYELYAKGKAGKIIVSGDHGRRDYDEVNSMKKFLLDRNVPPENIFMDHAGFTTYESLYRAKEVFKVKKIIVVTQQYHLMRAVFIAKELGLEVYGVPSDLHDYGDAVMTSNLSREIIARNKAFFTAKIFKPKPTFLGETIPVTGDGRMTDDTHK